MCQLTDTVYQTCGCRSPRKETCPAYRQWSSDCGACLGSILVSRTPPCGTMRQPAILTVGRCSDCDKRARRYEERRERMVCLAASHRAHKNCWETGCSPEGNRPGDVSVRDSFIEDGLAAAVITLPGPEWPEFCPKDALWYKGPSSKSSNGSSSSRSSPPRGYPNNSSKSNSSNSGQLRQKPPRSFECGVDHMAERLAQQAIFKATDVEALPMIPRAPERLAVPGPMEGSSLGSVITAGESTTGEKSVLDRGVNLHRRQLYCPRVQQSGQSVPSRRWDRTGSYQGGQ